MLSKLTMIGLHKYSDGHLWDNVILPDGMDKNLFIGECLRQGGEFPVLYADLDFMKMQIGEFCKKWYHNFDRWWKAYQFEYEALFNLDVKSTRTEEGSNEESGKKSSNGSRTERSNGSNTGNSSGNTTNTQTNTRSKAAYDSSEFQNVEQDVEQDVSTSTASSSTSSSNSVTNTLSDSEHTTGSSSHLIKIEEIRQGNQGVTMSQEMLLAEYNAWSYNIYNHMAEVFISEMCICIYL